MSINLKINPWFRLIAKSPCLVAAILFFSTGCAFLPAHHQEHPGETSGGAFDLYRGPLNHLSAVRRGACPMYPSCSEYARQAIAKHGFLKGWLMATDRLMRCGRDGTRLSPQIWVNGQVKHYDPVEGNDF